MEEKSVDATALAGIYFRKRCRGVDSVGAFDWPLANVGPAVNLRLIAGLLLLFQSVESPQYVLLVCLQFGDYHRL